MTRLNLNGELASHYESMLEAGDASIADPSFSGADDARVKAIIRHTDLVTRSPKDAVAGDIAALKTAGVPEEEIVRRNSCNVRAGLAHSRGRPAARQPAGEKHLQIPG